MSPDQAFQYLLGEFHIGLLPQSLQFIIYILPILVAVILCVIFWDVWVRYVRADFYNSLKYAVLEIKLPRENLKSPLAMEVFLNAIHNTSDGSEFAQYWKGEYRPYYSLEIISIEGQVKFMIWCEDRRKAGVMAALYSQFPGIEVTPVEDYTRSTHFDPATMKVYANEMEFTKDDPYPIKTYVDYGLDKDPKEELKVDPILPMLEFLASVPANQQVWIQIMVRAHKKDQRKPGHLFAKTDLWQDRAKELVNELMIRDAKTKATKEKEGEDFASIPRLSKGEQNVIESIERSVTKYAFDVGIRSIYIAPKTTFDTPFGIGGIISSFKQFGSESLNGFKPAEKWIVPFGEPWNDYKDMRRNFVSAQVIKAYKRRSYFYPPFKASKFLVLNSEELATIYHFPGAVATTPTLNRVPSKKAEAPTNLPV